MIFLFIFGDIFKPNIFIFVLGCFFEPNIFIFVSDGQNTTRSPLVSLGTTLSHNCAFPDLSNFVRIGILQSNQRPVLRIGQVVQCTDLKEKERHLVIGRDRSKYILPN